MPAAFDVHALRDGVRKSLQDKMTEAQALPGVVAGVTDATKTLMRIHATAPGSDPVTDDTVFAVFSATKPLTTAAALSVVDDGLLDLDAPASEYEPRLANPQVIEGFDVDGTPRLRPARRSPTTRELLTHTAGFGYDFFDETYLRLFREQQLPDIATATLPALTTPLLFDPGTEWRYGSGVDWAGLVVEAVTGQRLGEVLAERLLRPLGMRDTGFTRTDDMRTRTATMYHRNPDGSLRANPRFALPDDPQIHMGGQGLYSTVGDYLAFIRMWLNDGRADSGEQILRAGTVAAATRDQIGPLTVTVLPGVKPKLSHDVDFFPGVPKSWGLGFLINEADAPTGRPAGSLGWAGLANLYFWIDRHNGIGGFWATQLFPFFDPTALGRYLDFETAAYRALRAD